MDPGLSYSPRKYERPGMSVELHFNHHHTLVSPGSTLFECAESLAIHVPTSCRKQGKCKECVVEILEGSEYLSDRSAPEAHLKGNFRLSCWRT